jgi:hypothetical protein
MIHDRRRTFVLPLAGWLLVLAVLLMDSTAVSAHQSHPNGTLRLAWQAEHISRVTAVDLDARTSGAALFRATQAARVEQRDGRSCVVGAVLLFDVDDAFAFNIDETVSVELVLDRESSNGVVSYHDRAVLRPQTQTVRFTDNAPRWQSVTLTLERARFANRLLTAADFGLAAPGGDLVAPQPGDSAEIAVCGIRLKREGKPALHTGPQGTLALEVHNEASGALTPVRVGLYDANGRLPLPSQSALTFRRWEDERVSQTELIPGVEKWPYDGRYVFFIDGAYEAELEAGTYDLVIGKGPEYHIHQSQVTITAGERTQLQVTLPRWIDMPASGWYSGDDHIHFERTPADNEWISVLTRAEDIHVANLLQMGNPSEYFFSQYAFGSKGQYVVDQHALVTGQESPRTMQLGHTIGLNASRYHHPLEYFLYDKTAEAVRQDGGLFGYAHTGLDFFAERSHAATGLALDIVDGLVDFVEVLQFGQLGTGLLYDFLNLGFRLTPSAGTDWPYLSLPGAERVYVQVAGAFSPQAFFDGMKAGRLFVTNGPMLALDVAGQAMGSEVHVKAGQTVTIKATARQNPDYGRLDRLELVIHGDVIKTVKAETGAETLELVHELQAQTSLWLAVRAYGTEMGLAHSAPVYVYVDGHKRFWKRAAVPELVARYKSVLEKISSLEINWAAQHEKDSLSPEVLKLHWDAHREPLQRRIEKALKFYNDLLAEAAQ